jgi:hypothetical protein
MVNHQLWHLIESAPLDRDLELSVIENAVAHVLVVRCRRVSNGWINTVTGKPIDIRPTHWREWQSDRHP